jgi:hypothetical protein
VPLAGLALYCFDYALTAVVLRRWLFAPRIPASRNGVVALLLLAGASTLPTIVGSIFFYETWRPDEDWVWSFGNPFALWRTALEAGLIRFAAVWAALIAAPAAPWFFEQYRSFRPLEAPREAATEVRCESRSAAT